MTAEEKEKEAKKFIEKTEQIRKFISDSALKSLVISTAVVMTLIDVIGVLLAYEFFRYTMDEPHFFVFMACVIFFIFCLVLKKDAIKSMAKLITSDNLLKVKSSLFVDDWESRVMIASHYALLLIAIYLVLTLLFP